MFKPVSGEQLASFDAETIALYTRRPMNVPLTTTLLKMPRTARNHLPIVAHPSHPYIKQRNDYLATFPYKMFGFFLFGSYAMQQFTKIYFPYGIILRRSIPSTWMQYISYRAPLGVLALAWWYYQREGPRSQRLDLTCDSEK